MTASSRDAQYATWVAQYQHLPPAVLRSMREAFLFGLTLGRNDHVRDERAPRERFDYAGYAAEANHA